MPFRPPTHRPAGYLPNAHDKLRGSAASRGYDHRWAAVRLGFLTEHPLCADCQAKGAITVAAEVHHIRKVRDAPALRLDPSNLLALCKPCHGARTARGE